MWLAFQRTLIAMKISANKTFAIASQRVVLPEGERPAAVVISGDTIEAIVSIHDLPAGVRIENFDGQVISPGLVDAHVHVNQPGRTVWEGIETASSAAAAGGITTIVDMPLNSSPVTTSVEALQAKRESVANRCFVDMGFYGGLVPDNVDAVAGLISAGVLGIKAFLCDSGLDEFPATGDKEFRRALPILKRSDTPLLVHAELAEQAPLSLTDRRSYSQYLASRPDPFETGAIQLLINLCREFNSPIHVVHLATEKACQMIAAAKSDKLPLSIETCPHYLYFSAEEISEGATSFKCAPPIRTSDNRQQLRQALRQGLIDTIGSDHSPCLPKLKLLEQGDFEHAWGGIASLQLMLPIVWSVALDMGWRPAQLAHWMSTAPADLIGAGHRKGKLQMGYNADIVVWDPTDEFIVQGETLFHRHPLTPYEGRRLTGVVRRTYLRGEIVFENGRIVGPPRGQLLRREITGSCA